MFSLRGHLKLSLLLFFGGLGTICALFVVPRGTSGRSQDPEPALSKKMSKRQKGEVIFRYFGDIVVGHFQSIFSEASRHGKMSKRAPL